MNQLELFIYGGCYSEVTDSRNACDTVGYFEYVGIQEGKDMYLTLYNCPKCRTTKSIESIMEDVR